MRVQRIMYYYKYNICVIFRTTRQTGARTQNVITVRQFNKVRSLFPNASFSVAVEHERSVHTHTNKCHFSDKNIIPNTGLLLRTESEN
jgi:hypothetical protein